jgi:hypothetical protein
MAFFDTLRRVMTGDLAGVDARPDDRRRLGDTWGLDEVGSGADDHTERPVEGASAVDVRLWERKLKRILDELPGSRGEWDDLRLEAASLGFNPRWMAHRQRSEFSLLVRRAVADRAVTEAEHRKLELARELLGIPEPEAERTLHAIVAEAESFFGTPAAEG